MRGSMPGVWQDLPDEAVTSGGEAPDLLAVDLVGGGQGQQVATRADAAWSGWMWATTSRASRRASQPTSARAASAA